MGGSNNSDKLICALSCVYFVSERRSIAGYVTERTDSKTHARGCKATIRILEF